MNTNTNDDTIRADADEHERRAREVEDMIKKADEKVDLGRERASGDNGSEHLDKLLTALDVMGKRLDDAFKRMDDMEKAKRDDDSRRKVDAEKAKRDDDHDHDDDDDDDERDQEKGKAPGEARPVVADAARRHALADAQTRVDAVAQRFGQRSDAPLHGESVRAYRTRQLRRYQKFSPMYKAADLDTINDEAVFSGVEERIYADACAAADSPDSIAPGTLRMRTRVTESGHRINEFFGSPNAWMDRFAANRRYVVRLNTKWGGGPTE
jgi:hypothetical protein